MACFFWASFKSLLMCFLGSLIYEKLGERAFGIPGKMAAFGSITLQNIGGKTESWDSSVPISVYNKLCEIVLRCLHSVLFSPPSWRLQPCPATCSLWSTSCPRWSAPSWAGRRFLGMLHIPTVSTRVWAKAIWSSQSARFLDWNPNMSTRVTHLPEWETSHRTWFWAPSRIAIPSRIGLSIKLCWC